jgi:hypothetical protein
VTSRAAGLAGIAGLAALAGLGWFVSSRAAPLALVVDNPRRSKRRRRRRRDTAAAAERAIATCERTALKGIRPQTFRKKADATRALLDANPELLYLVESDCGRDCTAYKAWTAHGRRGPKPRRRPGDGRFDALNERLELRTPGRQVASWREALDVTAPPSRRWADFGGRLEALEETTGLRLAAPPRTEAITLARALAEDCRQGADDVIPF